jgi:integrase
MATTCEVLKLTKRTVDDATPLVLKDGTVRQRLYLDTELRGFGLVVGATAKSFIAQRTVRGRGRRVTIGRYPVFTVDVARREAQQLLAKMARGEDPIEEKRKARARGFTLREALELTEQTLKTKGRSIRTIDGYRYALETYLKDWLDRALAEITRHEAQQRHVKIAEGVAKGHFAGKYSNGKKRKRNEGHGKNTANGVMVAFRAVYNRALRAHPELPANPCINVDWFKVVREKNELPLTRVHEWFKHVAEMTNSIRRDLLLFTLHTGLRRTSALTVRWEDVDLDQKELHIPRPKGGHAFDLPLTEFLVGLLKARQTENEAVFGKDCPWVFPAVSASGHIAEPKEEFEGIKWTIHDLRRWFLQVAESLDLSPYAIKLLVNHRLPGGDVTATYLRHEVERLRPAMEAIGGKLRTLCEPPKDKVVTLPFKAKRRPR